MEGRIDHGTASEDMAQPRIFGRCILIDERAQKNTVRIGHLQRQFFIYLSGDMGVSLTVRKPQFGK